MTKDEALKMALEALERGETELRWKAITTIKAALAQPEQWTPEDMAYRPGGLAQPEQYSDIVSDGGLDPRNKPEQEPEVDMCRVAQFKLDSLRDEGFVVNGYAIERRNDSAVTRGFITDGGMVCWWFDRDHEPMSPPKRQPLTEAEILKLGSKANISHDKTVCDVYFARAIEAAHGIGDIS